MSTNLVWEPSDRTKKTLPDALKSALRKRIGTPVYWEANEHDLAYLRGLIDGGVDGAAELYQAIEKHERVTVTEE